jgi:hypothetical protein
VLSFTRQAMPPQDHLRWLTGHCDHLSAAHSTRTGATPSGTWPPRPKPAWRMSTSGYREHTRAHTAQDPDVCLNPGYRVRPFSWQSHKCQLEEQPCSVSPFGGNYIHPPHPRRVPKGIPSHDLV